MIVKKQSSPDQPARSMPLHPGHEDRHQTRDRRAALEPHVGAVRQNETHRPGDVRHRSQQDLAFDKRLSNQPEFKIFQIAQPAVKQLRRGGGCCRAEIAHLGKPYTQPAAGRVAGDAAAIDSATDNEQVKFLSVGRCRHLVRTLGKMRLISRHSPASRELSEDGVPVTV